MSVLGRTRIVAALRSLNMRSRLVVTPLLDKSQVGDASIDVRLGHDFLTVKRGNLQSMDPTKKDTRPERFRTNHHLNLAETFYLHPNEMALASTLEYVRLPRNISAYVTSRSKWGRLGLVIATATAIHPGFTGTITLELVNHGNVPLVLCPGLTIAQLILHDAAGATPYRGDLGKQTSPLPPDTSSDWQSDMAFWTSPPSD
ncbi:MAG: dCTP deaminase [Burkholderiales bacterium]